MAGASALSPRARLASNCTWPLSSVRLLASTSLPRESSRTSLAPFGCVVSSECTKAWMPSLPENAVSPRSETMNHWVASESNSSLSAPAGRRHDVDARRQRADGLCDGESGRDLGIEALLDRHLAFPDPRAARFGEVIEIVTV